ncbi:serine/threonine protein kinase [Bythopirellula polymerisocia]|uniref:non-specific serine/threonine protein kinase n=1 Tax=Bythopirellula polymerisocia TaxID=2528003 RepID=A0A5C6CYP3_9BACT|nr:serine/threonine-protein kinase [Bythopirellula polymerisocia]TWU29690.1 Serine/threonine-protein kinase StkP [Bythopirellula polymerisocia]
MTPTADERHDLKLAEILAQLTDQEPADRPSLEELTNSHPDLADDLRQLWGTAMLVDAVAHHSQEDITPLMTPPVVLDMQPPRELGDFELSEEIGRGGMGIVYRARQRSLGRDVALKLILQGAQASPTDKARFQAEVAAAARLEHPNIVPIYEVGESDGWQYFGMQLITGQTLAKRIALGPVPEEEAVRLVLNIARAIAYAHSRGVIHRDLKPANILLDETGTPHVTDFGLAKHVTAGASLTQTGSILGTPSYMSPEQAAPGRGRVGPVSDVYSLGAILYSLLTGRAPFQGSSPVDTVLMVLEQDPLPPRLLNRTVNRDLEMITLKCLQKPTELRYSSAEALADDLEAFLVGDSLLARSGRLTDVVARVFRETHHATVLENWGVLWMWHAAVLLVMCLVTNWFYLERDKWPAMAGPWPYLALWGGGLAIWAPIFWALRRRAGPVTAVERQIAHAWGASIIAVILLFCVEELLGLPVLTLSPVLGLISGMVFVVKGGILAGSFYFHAAALFAMAIVMAIMQRNDFEYGVSVYGLVSAATFFIPGWKYYRQSQRNELSTRISLDVVSPPE